ncbi:hypothetical protein CLLI_05140 [Clostridium liquoris]|jgi:putative membrane protein|uniref:SHOCT domain-containing protein n=1 Tax=Clostridium liquoris TaxID=1289519 RepID=A0A2T0B8B2_9CLOT|nr:SHOCT domain-containing protein [Clostridium liquoris]PRR80130.1 hypothetical protein CLLI_05140 [Clostridium liquoris]
MFNCLYGASRFGVNGANGFNGFNGWLILMPLFRLALMAGAIVLIFKFFKKYTKNREALKILASRYASGEITEEDYVNRKKFLDEK